MTTGFAPAGARTSRAGADRLRDVLLVGYQDQGNLGMGYLAAVLQEHGHSVELVDVRDGPDAVAARAATAQPVVIGFSLIFQFFLPQFRAVAAAIRAAGVTSHLTIGGHYPSLCHDEVLAQLPGLDSVARYEGEHTLLELVQALKRGADWRVVPGLAFLAENGDVAESAARSLISDLDTLPHPVRPFEPQRILGFPTLPVLASRGCARRCSFCSIHTFYRTAPGKVVRVRKPAAVVREMAELHERYGARIILFQDDDFPLWGRAGRKWVDELVARLHDDGLAGRILWKISCRAEYIEPELFAPLRDAGLFLVYMGIESGVESGLEVLHKQLTVEQNLTGVRVLKELGISFAYGFMLFDPSSTFASVRANIGFLRRIVGDGSAAATFCRMLPYGGTPIREALRHENRLRGDVTHPDYDFLDRRLNDYHRLLDRAVAPWIHNDGLSFEIGWAWDELSTASRLLDDLTGAEQYRQALRSLTAESNERLFCLVEESATNFENGLDPLLDPATSRDVCQELRERMIRFRNEFVLSNVNQLTAAAETQIRGPVMQPQIH